LTSDTILEHALNFLADLRVGIRLNRMFQFADAPMSAAANRVIGKSLYRGMEKLWVRGVTYAYGPDPDVTEYANVYPSDSVTAIQQLEAVRRRGSDFLLIPKPAFWWLEYYQALKEHLERSYSLAVHDEETCFIFDLRSYDA
jgi:hypothetical protein